MRKISPGHTCIDGLFPGLYGDGTEPSDLLCQGDSLLDYALSLFPDDPADESHPFGLFGIDLAAGEDHVHGDRFPDDLGQSLGTPSTGDDPEGDLGLTKDGGGGGEEDVAHHGQLTTTSELQVRGETGAGRARFSTSAGGSSGRVRDSRRNR